jgi:hypothetical protein
MDALLVLTGVAASAAASIIDPPEHVLPSVADLANLVRAAQI